MTETSVLGDNAQESTNEPAKQEYDAIYLGNLMNEMSSKYTTENKNYLATILSNCKAELLGRTLTIFIPKGMNNDALNEEKLSIKQFLSLKLSEIEFDIEFTEFDTQFKSDIPYTKEDKLQDILKTYPDFAEWVKKLDLRY